VVFFFFLWFYSDEAPSPIFCVLSPFKNVGHRDSFFIPSPFDFSFFSVPTSSFLSCPFFFPPSVLELKSSSQAIHFSLFPLPFHFLHTFFESACHSQPLFPQTSCKSSHLLWPFSSPSVNRVAHFLHSLAGSPSLGLNSPPPASRISCQRQRSPVPVAPFFRERGVTANVYKSFFPRPPKKTIFCCGSDSSPANHSFLPFFFLFSFC